MSSDVGIAAIGVVVARLALQYDEGVVLVRIGCRVGNSDGSGRLNIRGEPMPGDSKENKREPVVYRDGEFFE